MKTLLPAARLLLVFTLLTGVIYPLAVTAVAQIVYPAQANGSLITVDGTIVGSALIGQVTDGPAYFHWRASAVNAMQADEAVLMSSGATNLGPTSAALAQAAADRDSAFRALNGLGTDADVPADMLYASGSGLDPHISPEAARAQAARIADARGLDLAGVLALIEAHTEAPQFGFLGQPRVNVLPLNLALDER